MVASGANRWRDLKRYRTVGNEHDRLVHGVENDLVLQVALLGRAEQHVEVLHAVHALPRVRGSGPASLLVLIEGRAAQPNWNRGRRRNHADSRLHAHHDGRVVSDGPEAPELDVVSKACNGRRALTEAREEAETHSWEGKEHCRGQHEERYREQGRPAEEGTRRELGAVELGAQHRRPLAVLRLELFAEMRERQHPRHHDDEAEEHHAVVQTGREHGARDEVQEREDGDLLVVRGGLAVRETRNLKKRGVLDAYGECRLAADRAGDLDE